MRCVRGVAAVCLLGFWTSRLSSEPLQHIQKAAEIMGATFVVEIYSADRGCAKHAADEALDEVRRIDRMLSDYRADSELSRLNANAANHPVRVSRELFDLLQRCREYSWQSEGTFDNTVGPLMKVWGFYKGSGRMPDPSEIQAALRMVGYQKVLLDRSNHTVLFTVRGVSLDPGGVGKGYAVDHAVDVLKRHHVGSAFISGGGSSIYGLGAPPDSPRGWPVHIENPWNAHDIGETVYLKNRSLSTSGEFEKFFWAEGRVYGHIMDPRTGYPATGVASVSVAAPKTLDSEIWAKPYFIQGRKWTLKHKPKEFAVYLCEDSANKTCFWLGR
jgi:FAD:protein FMN transferase